MRCMCVLSIHVVLHSCLFYTSFTLDGIYYTMKRIMVPLTSYLCKQSITNIQMQISFWFPVFLLDYFATVKNLSPLFPYASFDMSAILHISFLEPMLCWFWFDEWEVKTIMINLFLLFLCSLYFPTSIN